MPDRNLALLRSLQSRATSAAQTGLYGVDEMRKTFDRLRAEARQLHVRLGFPPGEFDAEVPPLSRGNTGLGPRRDLERHTAVKLALEQLAAHMGGYASATEFDAERALVAKEKAEAENAEAGRKTRKVGFGQ
jgi:hypothetical protein